jgi:outer membrane protein assembly factor BamB
MRSPPPNVSVRLLLVCTWGLVFAGSPVRAGDWPQFRGPNRDAVWNELGVMQTFPPEGLRVRWRAPAGGGCSSPVVATGLSQTSIPIILGDYVFGGKSPGKLVCLEARTGMQVCETDKVTARNSGAAIHLTPNGDSVSQ